MKYIQDILVKNPLLKGLELKGNYENAIRTILDSDICEKIRKIGNSFYELEIGYGTPPLGSAFYLQVEPNVVRYLDTQRIEDTMTNPEKFKMILDVLIDIAEKIERNSNETIQDTEFENRFETEALTPILQKT